MTTEFLVSVQGGAKIWVPNTLANATTYVLLEQETWFEDELAFVRACVSSGQCAVDVGANLGVFTTALAAGAGPQGRVLAFEPTGATAALLRRTVETNRVPQVGVIEAGLADRRGRGLLEIGDTPELNALIEAPSFGRDSVSVELLTLDDELRDRKIDDVAFLKIDAEGAELRVGLGARRTLQKSEPLVLFEIRHASAPRWDLLEMLETLGFEPYRLVPGLDLLVPFRREDPLDDYQLNLFACTPGRSRVLHRDGLLARRGPFPEALPRCDEDAVEYLRSIPGGREDVSSAGDYSQALIHYAQLQTAELEPGEQAAHLAQALRLAERACRENGSVARLMTYARLAADSGKRRIAVDLLATLKEALESGVRVRLEDPCLPLHPLSPALGLGDDATQWARYSVIETLERLRAFSSLYRGPAGLEPLEFLRDKPYYRAEMERRRQLMRMRSGVQPGPEPHPLLTNVAPDNLNPWFWASDW